MVHLRPPARYRGGFTLIELVVVMGIMGVMTALLLAAVQQAREAANRTACANNLRQLTLGLHDYHDAYGRFPPAAATIPQLHGWGSFLLPFLEQQSVGLTYHWEQPWYAAGNQPAVRTHLPIMLCPSAPEPNRMVYGVTSGTPWSAAPSDYSTFRRVSADLVDDGYIAAPADPAGVLRLNSRTALNGISDGTSNTLLLVEVAGRPDLWQMGRRADDTVSGAGWAQSANSGYLYGFDPESESKPGPCAINCTNDNEIYGFHPGGANVSFADGSVRFLSAGLSIQTLAALVTQKGGETLAEDPF